MIMVSGTLWKVKHGFISEQTSTKSLTFIIVIEVNVMNPEAG